MKVMFTRWLKVVTTLMLFASWPAHALLTIEITGGSDLTGTPMRGDLHGGGRKKVLVSPSTGFKGHKIVKKKGGRYRYTYDGLRKRRAFRGNVISSDTRQINLKVVESGSKSLSDVFSPASNDDASGDDSEE